MTEHEMMLASARCENPCGPKSDRPLYRAWAAMTGEDAWTDVARFVGRGPRGSVRQRLYVVVANADGGGERRQNGVAFSCADEVSGEIEPC